MVNCKVHVPHGIVSKVAIAIAAGLLTSSWFAERSMAQERDAVPTRQIPLDGQLNFRDLGGYTTEDGRRVKWRQVFRSGELSDLTDRDVETLGQIGIRNVVNFLTEAEIAKAGEDRIPEGADSIPSPMETGNMGRLASVILEARKTGDFSKVPPEINPDLHRLLMAEGKDHYARLLRDVADPNKRPLVFHCSHGIHRTGTGTAILLSALGVPWETIRKDYLLSNLYRKEAIDRRVDELAQLYAKNTGVPLDEVDRTNIEAFYVLQGSYIDASLAAAVEKYGSMDGYVRNGLGLQQEEIDRLRDELLEPNGATEDDGNESVRGGLRE